jgi:hypothetical protein
MDVLKVHRLYPSPDITIQLLLNNEKSMQSLSVLSKLERVSKTTKHKTDIS